METVIYRKETEIPEPQALEEAFYDRPEYRQKLEALGMRSLLKRRADDRYEEGRLDPGLFYPEITAEEDKVWEWLLPSLEFLWDYTWDYLPDSVLDELAWAKNLNLFDAYYFRTPEVKTYRDPILIGVRRRTPYLIARWGEALEPFEEIRARYTQAQRRRNRGVRFYLFQ